MSADGQPHWGIDCDVVSIAGVRKVHLEECREGQGSRQNEGDLETIEALKIDCQTPELNCHGKDRHRLSSKFSKVQLFFA